MLDKLFNLTKKVKALNQGRLFITIIKQKEVDAYILRLNRIEQLAQEGIDAMGKHFGTYSEFTANLNDGNVFTFDGFSVQKIAGEPYNLLDTSKFYKSFDVVVWENGFLIEADDKKDDGYLQDRYGIDILGLTRESKSELIKKIRPLLISEVKRLIF